MVTLIAERFDYCYRDSFKITQLALLTISGRLGEIGAYLKSNEIVRDVLNRHDKLEL